MSNAFTYKGVDGTEIHARSWVSVQNPKAIVQIAHGMAEHMGRYDAFAQFLNDQQIIVYGNDHRGHGKTGEAANSIGYFADKDGFETVMEDLYQLTTIIQEKHPNIPIILFGHSMGSFLSRRYVQKYGDVLTGLILSGTGGDPGFIGKVGKYLAKREIKKVGAQTASEKLNKLTFGNYNKKFNPAQTDFDWLTRDRKEIDNYINDPFCGFVCSTGFFYDLLDGLEVIHRMENRKRTPKDLPIFLIAGDKDPVGNYGKGVKEVYKGFQRIGITDITYKLYPGARHEILNELNREEVMKDIFEWILIHINRD